MDFSDAIKDVIKQVVDNEGNNTNIWISYIETFGFSEREIRDFADRYNITIDETDSDPDYPEDTPGALEINDEVVNRLFGDEKDYFVEYIVYIYPEGSNDITDLILKDSFSEDEKEQAFAYAKELARDGSHSCVFEQHYDSDGENLDDGDFIWDSVKNEELTEGSLNKYEFTFMYDESEDPEEVDAVTEIIEAESEQEAVKKFFKKHKDAIISEVRNITNESLTEALFDATFHDGPMSDREETVQIEADNIDDAMQKAYKLPQAKHYTDVIVGEHVSGEYGYGVSVLIDNYWNGKPDGHRYDTPIFVRATSNEQAENYVRRKYVGKFIDDFQLRHNRPNVLIDEPVEKGQCIKIAGVLKSYQAGKPGKDWEVAEALHISQPDSKIWKTVKASIKGAKSDDVEFQADNVMDNLHRIADKKNEDLNESINSQVAGLLQELAELKSDYHYGYEKENDDRIFNEAEDLFSKFPNNSVISQSHISRTSGWTSHGSYTDESVETKSYQFVNGKWYTKSKYREVGDIRNEVEVSSRDMVSKLLHNETPFELPNDTRTSDLLKTKAVNSRRVWDSENTSHSEISKAYKEELTEAVKKHTIEEIKEYVDNKIANNTLLVKVNEEYRDEWYTQLKVDNDRGYIIKLDFSEKALDMMNDYTREAFTKNTNPRINVFGNDGDVNVRVDNFYFDRTGHGNTSRDIHYNDYYKETFLEYDWAEFNGKKEEFDKLNKGLEKISDNGIKECIEFYNNYEHQGKRYERHKNSFNGKDPLKIALSNDLDGDSTHDFAPTDAFWDYAKAYYKEHPVSLNDVPDVDSIFDSRYVEGENIEVDYDSDVDLDTPDMPYDDPYGEHPVAYATNKRGIIYLDYFGEEGFTTLAKANRYLNNPKLLSYGLQANAEQWGSTNESLIETKGSDIKAKIVDICSKYTSDFGVHPNNIKDGYEIRLGKYGQEFAEQIGKDIEELPEVARVRVDADYYRKEPLNDISAFIDVWLKDSRIKVSEDFIYSKDDLFNAYVYFYGDENEPEISKEDFENWFKNADERSKVELGDDWFIEMNNELNREPNNESLSESYLKVEYNDVYDLIDKLGYSAAVEYGDGLNQGKVFADDETLRQIQNALSDEYGYFYEIVNESKEEFDAIKKDIESGKHKEYIMSNIEATKDLGELTDKEAKKLYKLAGLE